MNPEPPGYKVGSLPDRPQSSTSGRLRTLFESQETDRDMALGGSASFRLRFLFSVNLSALTGLNKRGPQTGSPLRNSHTYIHSYEHCSVFTNCHLTHFMSATLTVHNENWRVCVYWSCVSVRLYFRV